MAITAKLGLWCWLNDQRFELAGTDSGQTIVYVAPGQWDTLSDWEKDEIIKKDIELAKEFAFDNTRPADYRPSVKVESGKRRDSIF